MNEELTREEIGEYLRNMRKSTKQTAVKFSYGIGVTHSSYTKWELGKSLPRDPEALIISVRNYVKSQIRKGA